MDARLRWAGVHITVQAVIGYIMFTQLHIMPDNIYSRT